MPSSSPAQLTLQRCCELSFSRRLTKGGVPNAATSLAARLSELKLEMDCNRMMAFVRNKPLHSSGDGRAGSNATHCRVLPPYTMVRLLTTKSHWLLWMGPTKPSCIIQSPLKWSILVHLRMASLLAPLDPACRGKGTGSASLDHNILLCVAHILPILIFMSSLPQTGVQGTSMRAAPLRWEGGPPSQAPGAHVYYSKIYEASVCASESCHALRK